MSIHVILAVLGYFIFAAGVGAMPAPTAASKATYVWLYRFLQRLAANADRLAQHELGSVLGPNTVAVATHSEETTMVATGDGK